MPKKKSSRRREKGSGKSVELPETHEILSKQISRILNGFGQITKESVSLNGSTTSKLLEGSVEFALKQELEDPATDCIHFFDEPKSNIEPTTIKVEPDQYPVKTEGMFFFIYQLTCLVELKKYIC